MSDTNITPPPAMPPVITEGGGPMEDRIKVEGDNPIELFLPPWGGIEFGNWTGMGPGPPAGTGMTGGAPAPPAPTAPTPESGETEQDFLTRCQTALEGQDVDAVTAENMCAAAWLEANPAARAARAQPRRKRE